MTISKELEPLQKRIDAALHELRDYKSNGSYTTKDIGKVQNLLHKVDEVYKEGKFEKHGKIPEGQAELSANLHAAHVMAQNMMQNASEE